MELISLHQRRLAFISGFCFGIRVQDTERNRTEIKELRQEMKELATILQHLIHEQRRMSEQETHEREKLLLRIQNELLKLERRLPGGRQKN